MKVPVPRRGWHFAPRATPWGISYLSPMVIEGHCDTTTITSKKDVHALQDSMRALSATTRFLYQILPTKKTNKTKKGNKKITENETKKTKIIPKLFQCKSTDPLGCPNIQDDCNFASKIVDKIGMTINKN